MHTCSFMMAKILLARLKPWWPMGVWTTSQLADAQRRQVGSFFFHQTRQDLKNNKTTDKSYFLKGLLPVIFTWGILTLLWFWFGILSTELLSHNVLIHDNDLVTHGFGCGSAGSSKKKKKVLQQHLGRLEGLSETEWRHKFTRSCTVMSCCVVNGKISTSERLI